jgi:phage terminase small subunit
MPILKNPRHESFAHGVAKGLAAGQAYVDAGYSQNGKDQSAEKLLRKTEIRARVDEIRANIEKAVEHKVGVTKAWVIEKLKENLERAMQRVPVLDHDGAETGEYRYEGNVANKALELIGKELGMFITRTSLENPDGTPIKSITTVYIMPNGTKING